MCSHTINSMEIGFAKTENSQIFGVANSFAAADAPWQLVAPASVVCTSGALSYHARQLLIKNAAALSGRDLSVTVLFYGTPIQSQPNGYSMSLQVVVSPPAGTAASRTFTSQPVATELDTLYPVVHTPSPSPEAEGATKTEYANVPNQVQTFAVIPNEYLVDGAVIKFAMNSTVRIDYLSVWPTFVSGINIDIYTL
jgi:hypothetical protein